MYLHYLHCSFCNVQFSLKTKVFEVYSSCRKFENCEWHFQTKLIKSFHLEIICLMSSLQVHPVNDEESPLPAYTPRSLGFIPIESSFRRSLIRLISSRSSFDSFILCCIILNTISMACVDYRYVDDSYEPVSTDSWRNYIIEIAENFFMAIFVAECLIKIIALGLIRGPRAYLKNSWNVFDFIIVILR